MEQEAVFGRLRGRGFVRDVRAVSAIEYALLVGLVAVAVGPGLLAFGDDLQAALSGIGDQVTSMNLGNAGPITGDTSAT